MRNCDTSSTTIQVLTGNRRRCNHPDCMDRKPMTRKQAEAHRNFHNKPKAEVIPVVKAERKYWGGYTAKCPQCLLTADSSVSRGLLMLKPLRECPYCSKKFRVEL